MSALTLAEAVYAFALLKQVYLVSLVELSSSLCATLVGFEFAGEPLLLFALLLPPANLRRFGLSQLLACEG